ncbi:hypothetical protein BDY24DRAFT_414577 [Mrakia frigida]|uniref:uncharacterized protein n=1 Tax=Mrakia frigida TaxID=29902 RepID=UPI003FCC248C
MSPPPSLETLPSELILHTLSFLPLDAIASFSQTSVFFSQLVYGNGNDGSLWRTLYLSSFDDPSISAWDLRPPPSKDGSARSKRLALEKEDRRYQWREGARQSVTALREWKAGRMDLVRAEADQVDLNYRALLNLLLTAPPAGTPSLNLPKLVSALPSSLPTLHMLPDQTQPVYHQLMAHLLPLPLPKSPRAYDNLLNEAREIVYSIAAARGSLETPEGKIDFKVVHALNVVQHWNMTRGMEGQVWDPEETCHAPWPWRAEHARPAPRREEIWTSEKSGDWDWAGIGGGEWVGCYSFVDFSDYITFNYPELTRQRGKPSLVGVEEAVGDLMHLKLVPTCARPSATSSTLPRIHFSGTSNSPVQSEVRGNVRLTNDNPPQVRVTYVISYGGSEKWKLEGMQMGGIGGKRGVVGIWSEAHPGPHSPSGPFYFWKKNVVSEEGQEE